MIKYVDGYAIEISNSPPQLSKNKLYFLNLGGYDKNQFTELHKNILVVADRENKAKIKGIKQILNWESYHRDYQYEIDQKLQVNQLVTHNDRVC